MKTIILLLGLFFSTISLGNTINLKEALDQKVIAIKTLAEGGHDGKTLKIYFTNLTKKNIEIKVPAGQLFLSEDTDQQDLIIVKERILALEKKESRIGKFYALCTQANNLSPTLGAGFLLGSMVEGNLLKAVQFISSKKLQEDPSAQAAIWAFTDDHRLEYVRHPELQKYCADLLGKPVPNYTLINQNRSNPGQRAYEEKPLAVEGLFKYELEENQKVSLILYNDKDELMHTFKDFEEQRSGYHKFKFFFEIHNLPKGKYWVRMIGEKGLIEEMEVDF